MRRASEERFVELLARVLEDGLEPGTVEARELMGDSTAVIDVEQRLVQARRVVAMLDRSARSRREELEECLRARDELDQQAARDFVERRRSWPPRRWLLAIAAAAAVALVWLVWVARPRWTRGGPSPEIQLGARLEIHAPASGAAAYERFTWSYDLSPGGWFVVRVRDPRSPGSEPELARSGRLGEPRWQPPPEETRAWPDEILVEVQAFDGTARPAGSATRLCSRSPR
jgi:hypothetical protein